MFKVAESLWFVLGVDSLQVVLKHGLFLALDLLLGHGVRPRRTLWDIQNCSRNIDIVNTHLQS